MHDRTVSLDQVLPPVRRQRRAAMAMSTATPRIALALRARAALVAPESPDETENICLANRGLEDLVLRGLDAAFSIATGPANVIARARCR